ncbi:hypothetical protein ACFSJU_01080 [Paradesertivirga mongoliensis]|uniref:Uncharacterized protein n=1 Tax=Paradesertivirga mongoliensis TaxID=2100740 RepID=A0ABW4ZHI9_9SPHI|nr:hypothetical protein [Pedobacter mongoliensis]
MTDPKDKFYPGFNDENLDRDEDIKRELGAEVSKDDLSYDPDKDSFEIDVKSEDEDYDHPDPYITSVKSGSDFDSDFDEANITANDEYHRANDAAAEIPETGEYGMHIDSGKIVQLDPLDEELAMTPEDERDDLDEEGYPKNDLDKRDNEYLK